MKEELIKIDELIGNFDNIEKSDMKELMQKFFSNERINAKILFKIR